MPVTKDTQTYYSDYLNGITKPVLTGAGPYDFTNSKPIQFTNSTPEQEQKKYFDKNKAFNVNNIRGYDASYLFEDSNPVVQYKKSQEQNKATNSSPEQEQKKYFDKNKAFNVNNIRGYDASYLFEDSNPSSQHKYTQEQNKPDTELTGNAQSKPDTELTGNIQNTQQRTAFNQQEPHQAADNQAADNQAADNQAADNQAADNQAADNNNKSLDNSNKSLGKGSLAAALGSYFSTINNNMSPDVIKFRNKENITSEQAIQRQKDEQRARQIANRDYRGEAEQDAIANATIQNAQNKQSLGNVSAAASVLNNVIGTADYDTAKQRSDLMQQRAEGLSDDLYNLRRVADNYGYMSAAQRMLDAERTELDLNNAVLSAGIGTGQSVNNAVTSNSNQPTAGTSDSNQPTAGMSNTQNTSNDMLSSYGFTDSKGKTYTKRDADTRESNIKKANEFITTILETYPKATKHLLNMDSELIKKIDYLLKQDDLAGTKDNAELLNILSNLDDIEVYKPKDYTDGKDIYAGDYRRLQSEPGRMIINNRSKQLLDGINSLYNKYRQNENNTHDLDWNTYFNMLNYNKPSVKVPYKV